MTTAATHHEQENTTEATLFVAFELREKTWKLGFTTGQGQKPRERTVTARQQERVLDEIAQAKRRLGLPDTAPVVSCYELKRCTRSLSKPRSYEETMCCRFDPAPEPMPAEAPPLSPPCCVSTHRSRVVDPDGPTMFLDHREALFGIPQMPSFTQGPGHLERFPVESSPPPISEDSYRGEAPCSRAPCTRGSNVTSPSVSGLSE